MFPESIVTISGDAGGAAALAPVLSLLQRDDRVSLKHYAYAQAPDVLQQAGIPNLQLHSCDVALARRILARERAALLLTATSVNDLEFEKQFVVAARQSACPSLGVLDFWSNYVQRFEDEQGVANCSPDVLTVMDACAASGVRNAGIPSELKITGHPAFDGLLAWRQTFSADKRRFVRTALGVQASDFLVIFVSQAIAELYGDAKKHLGFDQDSVRQIVTQTLAQLPPDQRRVLAIRRHPREIGERVENRHGSLDVVLDSTPHRWDAVMAADLVVGMNSVLLLEASYLGAPVISLQPGLRGDDFLPSNGWGGSAAAYRLEDATALLSEYVLDASARTKLGARAAEFAPEGHAAERICECVHQQLARSTRAIWE
ncbi:MAG: hypothetical protein ABL986_19530 [Vicinamibacterales bacterium]